ncbi:hypothetical protein LOB55_07230 [Lactobacillus delbrueckii subsp. lactis]|jgi:hypothetical protein|uniref:hypothetical protein n=1 Tax=Lactobacillus delbrueckii TaxID=1584 RepID=UPI0001EC32DE|nr:hypothetical protein [Lactobacillus delbrueckii]ADQ61088.1 Hypothetical protein LDBND_1050 [Lactobacillus delbrueckii subsp. bulgaricus ND02]MBO3082353.1 hypothetical protein [Lactobacillus delbrueckii subsp. bulgaricus]MCD5438710.1 hypothetical protein [Lactobacillus delbrueckii subsp. lactis]MCZ0796563.1 hypothetical protein [Lactobacillus delbrueckii subsp. lactis]MDG5848768.1 hypothetical protein [Lactobacillus delbrueckii]
MQFMLSNLDRPVDLDLVKEYNRIVCESLCDKPGMPAIGKNEEVLRLAKEIDHPIKQGFYLFGHIAREQWFNDGNERTAQLVANHVFVQNNVAMLAVPVEERENFWHKLVKFYETGQQDDLNDFLYKTSIGIMPGGLTMEKTREIDERNRKWLGLE